MTKESLMAFIPMWGLGLTNITRKTSGSFKEKRKRKNENAVVIFLQSIKIIISLYFHTHTHTHDLIPFFFFILNGNEPGKTAENKKWSLPQRKKKDFSPQVTVNWINAIFR